MDETLASARNVEKGLTIRPNARSLLATLAALPSPIDGARSAVEVVVWSAGHREHVDRCVTALDPSGTLIRHVICRGPAWLSHGGVTTKDVSLLKGRGESTVLIDDSPYVAMRAGGRAVVVPRFDPMHPSAAGDTTLLYVLNMAAYVTNVMVADVAARDATRAAQVPAARVLRALEAGEAVETGVTVAAMTVAAAAAMVVRGLRGHRGEWKLLSPRYGLEGDKEAQTEMARMDEAVVPRVLRTHPFVATTTLFTPCGAVTTLVLDVVDPPRLTHRVGLFLGAFGPAPPPSATPPTTTTVDAVPIAEPAIEVKVKIDSPVAVAVC